jgi:hypothetical protein
MSSSQTLASSSATAAIQERPVFDFVGSDIDALASHMGHCAASRGRWFAMKGNLQQAHAIASGRIVTMACIAASVGIALLAFA